MVGELVVWEKQYTILFCDSKVQTKMKETVLTNKQIRKHHPNGNWVSFVGKASTRIHGPSPPDHYTNLKSHDTIGYEIFKRGELRGQIKHRTESTGWIGC